MMSVIGLYLQGVPLTDYNMLTRIRPDYTNTEPASDIGPFPQWGDPEKIVSMDPWGHLAPWIFKDLMNGDDRGLRVRTKFGAR